MACKIEFKNEHKNNNTVSISEKLVFATVRDKADNISKLWEDIKKLPFIKDLENAQEVMLNYFNGEFGEDFIRYEGTVEPKMFFKSTKGNVYNSYKEALVDSEEGFVEVGFLNSKNYKTEDVNNIQSLENANFHSLMTIGTSTDTKSINGFVNNYIVNDLLSGQQVYDMKGMSMYVPEGATESTKAFNGELVRSRAIQNFDKEQVTKDGFGNVRIEEKQKPLSGVVNEEGVVETVEKTIQDVQEKGFEQLVNKTSPEQAVDVVLSDYVQTGDFEKFFSGFPLLQKENIKDLRDKLFSLLNRAGVQLISIEEYKKNYKTKNEIEPDAKALADLFNGVIALSQGASIEDLAEEVSHFLVETIDEAELKNILEDLYLVDSLLYETESQKYREIYSKQGNFTERQIETKVRKEILGKLIAQGILKKYETTTNEQERSFVGKIINAFNKIIERIKFHFSNPRIQVEIQDLVEKISSEVLNEELDREFDLKKISEKYNESTGVYYATNETKKEILALQRTLDVLESRLKLAKEANVKDLNAYRNNVQKAANSLKNGNTQLVFKLVVSETESLVQKLKKALDKYEKDSNRGNLLSMKSEQDLLKAHLIPSIEELRNHVDSLPVGEGFSQFDKDRIKKQIEESIQQQSQNNSRFNKLTNISYEEATKEIALKYGISEQWLPIVVTALSKKQDDISILYRWFGNPEHSSVPYLGLLAKILDSDRIKKVSVISPIAKKLEKFLTENNWTQADNEAVIAKNDKGEYTHDLISPAREQMAMDAFNEFETGVYNKIKFGTEESKYVSTEEYRQKHRLNAKGEKTEPLELIDDTNLDHYYRFQNELQKWKEENQILAYRVDVYRERQATYEKLGFSPGTISFLNSISSDRAALYSQISDEDGNIDPSLLERNKNIIDDLNDLNAKLKNATSPFDVVTEEVYFEINKDVTEKITIEYKDENDNNVKQEFDIPTIVFKGNYSRFNGDTDLINKEAPYEVKLAYDLTRRNLLNAEKYGKENRKVNEKYFEEITRVENYYSKEAGFDSYDELLKRGTEKEVDEITKDINKALRNFLEISGGLSFNEEFYERLSSMSEGLTRMEQLDRLISSEESSDLIIEKAQEAKRLLKLRSEIFKKYKSRFNPAEISVPPEVIPRLQDIDKKIDGTFEHLRKELEDSNIDFSESIASFSLNEAFENDLKDSGLNRIDFMLRHVKSDKFNYIKSDFRSFQVNGIGDNRSVKRFLNIKGYLNKDGSVNADFVAAIKTEAGLEQVISEFLSTKVYSYYKRFTPNGYDSWLNNLNNGDYIVEGKNKSFGDFLRNMSRRQNNESYVLGNQVEEYFKINPALQYTDGEKASFKEQLNPLFNPNYKDGRTQWNLDKWGDREFFSRFGIDFENFKNNPLSQEDMLQEAAKNHKHLDYILQIRDMNRMSLDLYGEGRNFSAYRIARRRMTSSESIRNIDKPIDRLKGWYNQVFTTDVDVQDYGAMNEYGETIQNSGLSGLRIIPKYGLYDLADMKDNSLDVYHNTLYMLNGAINYGIKKDSLEDVLKLESALEQATFSNGKKGTETQAHDMFKEFVDAQYFGILRNNRYVADIMGRKVDLTRMISAIDRYVRKVNTAWSVAVSVTGLTSSSLFGLTEGLTAEHMSTGAYSFGFGQVAKDYGNYIGEIGQLDRNNKSYLTARLLGIQDFDALHNAAASGRSVVERSLKNLPHKITEMFTNHTGIQVAYAMLYDTRFDNGKWYSYNEFRNKGLIDGKTRTQVNAEWESLKDNSLYYNYDFNETNDKIKVSEKGMEMIRNYYKEQVKKEVELSDENYSQEQIDALVESKVNEVNKHVFTNVSGRIGSVHSFLEGRVLEEQKSSATRNAFLNPLLAHRNWFSNTLQRKFKNGHYNFVTGQYEVGTISTVFNSMNPLAMAIKIYKNKEAQEEYGKEFYNRITNPKLNAKQVDLVNEARERYGDEEANKLIKVMLNTNHLAVRRFGVEVVLLASVLMFGALVAGFVDDPERKNDFATQYMGYLYFRLASEYGSSNIVTGLPQAVDMVNRPAIMFNLFKEVVNEDNYSFEPVESGPYKGMPKLYKAVAKQTSLRQFYDFIGMDKKSQSYRHFNSASLGMGLLDKKAEE